MLDVTANNLWNEVKASVERWKAVTDASTDIRQQYAQNCRTDWVSTGDVIENHPFEHVANMVPTLAYNNPGIEVESAAPGEDDVIVEAIYHGLQQWIDDIDLCNNCLQYVAYDLQFSFGVTVMTMEPLPGYEGIPGGPLRPVPKRLDPIRFFADYMAPDPDSFRFMGHICYADKADLMARAQQNPQGGWNTDVIESLPEDANLDSIFQKTRKKDLNKSPGRKQVVYYEVYVRETRMIYTIGFTPPTPTDAAGGGKYLREPRPYEGPEWGPYTIFGIYYIPGETHPLAPLTVTQPVVKEINAHLGQVRNDAASAKRLMFVDASRKDLLQAIATGKNNNVYAIPGFSKNMAELYDISGPTPDRLQWIEWRRQYLYQLSGLTDTRRGNVDPNATATAESIAEEQSNVRQRYAQAMFRKGVTKLLHTAASLMFNSIFVQFQVAFADKQTGQKVPTTFQGGVLPGQSQEAFNSLHIKVSPYSMEFISEAVRQRRAMQSVEVCMQIVPMAVQYPFLNVKPLLDDLFEAMNVRNGANRYINFQVLEQMQVMNMLMQAGLVGPEAGGQPTDKGTDKNGTPKKISNDGGDSKANQRRAQSGHRQAATQQHSSVGDNK